MVFLIFAEKKHHLIKVYVQGSCNLNMVVF